MIVKCVEIAIQCEACEKMAIATSVRPKFARDVVAYLEDACGKSGWSIHNGYQLCPNCTSQISRAKGAAS